MKHYQFEIFIDGNYHILEGRGTTPAEAFEHALLAYDEPLDPERIEGEVIFEPKRDDEGEELPPIVDWFNPGEC